MTEGPLPAEPVKHAIADAPGVRNAWQWLAMLTMTLDHIGYMYSHLEFLRFPGRLGMPLYAILFVITLQKHQVHLWRIVILAILSQVQYMYIFQQYFYVYGYQLPQLNIIFGFAIFAWFAAGVDERNRLKIVSGVLMMWIPVSYGWYLYFTLGIFCWLDNKYAQRGAFAVLMAVYTYVENLHPRQMLAAVVPFLTWLKAPRPNKYLYRWFYPGHLLILASVNYWVLGIPLSLPMGKVYDDAPDYYQEYYQTEPEYYDDANEPSFYYEDLPVYGVGESEQ